MRRTTLVIGLALALTYGHAAAAETAPKVKAPPGGAPAAALYLGNSFFYYNNSLHGHVRQLLQTGAPDIRHRSTSATISGGGLTWIEIDPYFKPNGVASYTFNARNELVFADPKDKLFDLAIMMDCSQCPIHPKTKDLFGPTAAKHAADLRRHGAEPALFMSWAYKDKPEMTAELAEAYVRVGNEIGALVIPAGLAFAAARQAHPTIELYVADLRHPTLAGTYLAAATVFATLFNRSPVGNPYDAGLGAETARALQTVAWETTQAFFKP